VYRRAFTWISINEAGGFLNKKSSWADEINRVGSSRASNFGALKRPRLGEEEPSDDD
jgi:hypothetical protein